MGEFKITDLMRQRAEENKEGLLGDLENKRTYGIAFCDKFYRDVKGNFDTWGNFDGEVDLMYVADIHWRTVIIDGAVRWDSVDGFLDKIKNLEDRITYKNEMLWNKNLKPFKEWVKETECP